MKIIKYIAIGVALTLSGCSSKYEKLYNKKPGFYSYISGSVQGDNIDEEHYSKVYATPASCQKVVTSIVSLKALGGEYKYKTELLVTKRRNKIHDAIIRFSGDPTLTSEQLILLLQPLQNSKINGHIFLDSSVFKTSVHSHNLMIDDIGTEYATPVSAINIDKNLIAVKITQEKTGKSIRIQADKGYHASSQVITSEEKSAVKLSWVDGVIHANGNLNSNDSILKLNVSPHDHDDYVLRKLKEVLSVLKIQGKLKIIRDEKLIDSQAQFINKIESLPLEEIIKPALKISDNLVFDSIYLTIIHTYSKEAIRSWEQGSNIIKELINTYFGIDTGNALFVDGSGLSRYNRIQPVVLLSLLKKGFQMPGFVNALAKPGEEDSTLKDRRKLSENIVAKTGNMSGISCLCGYSFASCSPKAFVFMSNSFAPPSKELFHVMDDFLSKKL